MDLTVQGTREYWFGAWNKGYNDGAFCLGNDGGGVYSGYGNQGGTQGSVVSIGRHVVELDRGEVKVDGAVTRTFEANEFQVNYPLYLCAQNRTGTLGYYADQASLLVHACQIYEDGVLVRDYVPVVRPFDGAVGFLERVSDAFVSFVGTGVTASGATHRDLVRPPAPLAFSAGLIDLDGHNLTLADADGSAEMELRNTAENTARVTLDVPAEKSAKLSLQLVGAIDLVKTGAGTLEANRANDAYTGGLTVEAGTVVNGRAFAYQPIWGAAGAWITVKSGAVYENNGYSGYRYNFDLAGVGQGEGALVNRVEPSPMQGAFWLQNYAGDMRLSGDALITLYARWGFSADDDTVRHALTFNGHTLTVNAGNQLFVRGVNATDAGRLVCAGFGETFDRRLSLYGIPSDFSKVTVEVLPSGRLSVEEPVTLGTYISQATNEANCVFQPITVRDRYQPHLAAPYRAVHLGTADNPKPVLDLSQLDEPYTFRYSEADPEGLLASFSVEPGATVVIDLGTRAISSGLQIVDLTANEFAKLANVTFTLTPELRARGYRLARRATGLYLDAGFSILVR